MREAGLYPRDLILRSEHRRMPRSLRRVCGQKVNGEKREQNSGKRGDKRLTNNFYEKCKRGRECDKKRQTRSYY